jgi:hypothetical protein
MEKSGNKGKEKLPSTYHTLPTPQLDCHWNFFPHLVVSNGNHLSHLQNQLPSLALQYRIPALWLCMVRALNEK